MSVTFTQIRQTIDLYEKVKVDSGEKIVKNEKIGRSKKIEFTITKKGSKFFAYFDGEKYAGTYNNQKKVEDIAKSYLKLVGEELQEVKGKAGSTDGDEEADKNIMMQLRKVVSLRGMKPVTFDDNKKAKIDPKVATKILGMYDKLKPAQKLQLQKVLSKSKRDFDKAVQQLKINEYFDEELQEAKEVMSRFRDDRLKKTVMNLAKQKGLKVKELPGGKVEVSGNARKVMDLTLAVQKDDVKIEGFASDAQRRAAFAQGYKAKGKDKKKDEELEERKFEAGKSASGYDIFHKDYSSAIQHATAFAKKKGQEIDPKEIDDKIATGPRKPGPGKENSFTLKTKKGKMWSVQVYNMGSKFELNMYLTSEYIPEVKQPPKKEIMKVIGNTKNAVQGREALRKKYGVSDKEADEMIYKAMTEAKELDEVGGSAFGGTIDKIQKVVDDKQAMKIDGVMVDMFTASLIMKIFKKVNKQNQDRMRKMKVTQLANAAYKLAGVKEEIELDEAIKYTHVAVDAKGKIIGFASKADDAKDMARRNKGVVHKLKKPMSPKVGDKEVNRPFNPVLKAGVEENYTVESMMKRVHQMVSQGASAKEIADAISKARPKNKVDVKTIEKLIKGVKGSATETRNITFKNFVNNN